ncbi:MAG: hypothetical protein WA274_24225 [Candidatus Acidiferrales bacterium]
MIVEAIGNTNRSNNRIKTRNLVALFMGLIIAALIYPNPAHAQLVGSMEADIPFQFHAGDTKLPAGKYVIRMLDDSDLTIMEISKPDGSVAALFQVHAAEANSSPRKSELIFNKYGHKYFLEKLFDDGKPDGSQVVQSNYEKRVGQAAAEAQEHVPAYHSAQQRTSGS